MIIEEPEIDESQERQKVGYTIPEHPSSLHTEFLKYTNDFPIEREKDDNFGLRHNNLIRCLNKYPGQSNIDEIDELKADLIWQDIKLSQLHGMNRRAEQLSLELDHLYARSRGRGMMGSKIMVTERHEILNEQEKTEDEKKFKFFRHKKPEQPDKTEQVAIVRG